MTNSFPYMFCLLQVLKAKFALCQYIAQNIKTFSKRSAFYALDGLVDKIGDIKVNLLFGGYTVCSILFSQ